METKPILVIYIYQIPQAELHRIRADIDKIDWMKNFHTLVLMSKKETKVEVFYEKDHIPLDPDKLDQLLSICKSEA